MGETIIKIEHVSKEYRLGAIGGGTLRGDLQSFMARLRGKEDPNTRIGQDVYTSNQRFLALDDVSFSVEKGERVGIIGHNGAGKSTLLKLLSRVTAPTTGTISYNGRIASMLEVGTGFHPELTGRENIYLNGAILGMSKAEIAEKFDDIVAFAEMEKFVDTPVKRYSSGMYVKLAFAVAAHLDSDILVMDEVLAVGDMKFQQKCLGKMDDVSKSEGKTVLYVSHNMNTIRQLCTRCIVLDHGKVIFDGDTEEAIGVYFGNHNQVFDSYVYGPEYHSCKKSINSFRILASQILNLDSMPFPNTKYLKMRVSCLSSKFWENVRFRMEIHAQSGLVIGTMLSKEKLDFSPNEEKNICISVCLDHLATGRYSVDIIAFVNNDFGTELYLDGVYPGFTIDVSNERESENGIAWRHKPWGNIQLHDFKVEVLEERAEYENP